MHEFYTVAINDISNLGELNLFDSKNFMIYKTDGFFSDVEAREKIAELYPNGISHHGRQYLHDQYHYVYDEKNTAFINHHAMIEITFELVRQAKFKDKPSRFESTFGCETLEEALKFRAERRNSNCKIYKVSTDSYFKADMSLLSMGTIPGNMILAEKYWSGKSSLNPFWEILLSAPVKILHEVQ